MKATIRTATEADATILAHLGAETFVATFGRLYDASDLDPFLDENHSRKVYQDLLSDETWGVWVAEDENGDAIGYAAAGPCSLPVPGEPPNAGELARLYLKKAAQGGGVGARLLETALEFLRDRFDRIFVSVYSENYVAQRLYARYGFVKIHDYHFMVGKHADPEWIMELRRP